jgi:hypothetical protein
MVACSLGDYRITTLCIHLASHNKTCPLAFMVSRLPLYFLLMASQHDVPAGLDIRPRQRQSLQSYPLETLPGKTINAPRGTIPNTPLAASTISFVLGSIFSLGLCTFLVGGFSNFWWSTYQLGFFVASWAAFHWGEFAVTAGWNREKCSVDCEYNTDTISNKSELTQEL